MTREDIRTAIDNLFCEDFAIDLQDAPENMSFRDDYHIDSMDMCEVFVDVENEFDLEIPVEEQMDVETIGDLVDLIAAKKGVTK